MREFEYDREEIVKYFGHTIPSTGFTWNRYCGQREVSLYIIFEHIGGSLFSNRFECLGWCYASSLPIRSREDGIAVMLWDTSEGNKVWCHISWVYMDTLIKLVQLHSHE